VIQRFLQLAALTEHFEFVTDPAEALCGAQQLRERAAGGPASAAAAPEPEGAPAAPSE
jgi:hypothetical protein